MNNAGPFTRRAFLAASAAVPCSGIATTDHRAAQVGPSSAELDSIIRLEASARPEDRNCAWFDGVVEAVGLDGRGRVIGGYRGVRCSRLLEGRLAQFVRYEFGMFYDLKSREADVTWTNPFTGKKMHLADACFAQLSRVAPIQSAAARVPFGHTGNSGLVPYDLSISAAGSRPVSEAVTRVAQPGVGPMIVSAGEWSARRAWPEAWGIGGAQGHLSIRARICGGNPGWEGLPILIASDLARVGVSTKEVALRLELLQEAV